MTLFALGIRLWGIRWGLPDARHPLASYHPDELINLGAAQAANPLAGQFDIGFYNYGAFYFYIVSFAQLLARGWGFIQAAGPSVGKLSPQAAAELAGQLLTGRFVTAIMGAAAVPILCLTGQRIRSLSAGIMAGFAYAIMPLAVLHARYLTVDVPAAFFVTLALFFAAGLKSDADKKSFAKALIGAAVSTGLAAATKYTAAIVIVAPLTALVLSTEDNPAKRSKLWMALAAVLGISAIAFVIGCPGILINFDAFWNGIPNFPGSGVRYELFEHSRQGHGDLFVNTGTGWTYHFWLSLRYGMGWPLWMASIVATFSAIKRREKAVLPTLLYFLIAFALTGLSAVRFARYMVTLLPAIALLIGVWWDELAERNKSATYLKLARIVPCIIALIMVAWAIIPPISDARDEAANYLFSEKRGQSIGFAKIPWFWSPPISPYLGAPSAPMRAKASESTDFQVKLPSSEWNTDVFDTKPAMIVLSNFETYNSVDRLHLAEPTKFMKRLKSEGYVESKVFGGKESARFWLSGGVYRYLPEDLLYTMPKVTIYERR